MIDDEDSALVARFLRGDASAFDTLFLKYQDYVYHIVYGIVGGADEARDLTQEVFLQVYRSLGKFRFNARFATWLYRVAVNRAVDAARAARRRPTLPLLDDPAIARSAGIADEDPAGSYSRREERATVQAALLRCPLGHREVLALRYYRDLSVEEIADTLGCSVTAAKVRLHRARKVFKDQYVKLAGPNGLPGMEVEASDVVRA